MATMFPDVWEDRNDSRAEAHIYRRLRDETPDDWFAVHSVVLTGHSHKSIAEADFVVVGPFGVLCLEVKGGAVTVEQGRWATNGHPLRESPFQQVGGATAALRGDLKEKFPPLRRALVEFAVAFPDSHFVGVGAGIEHAILYDQDDVDRPFDRWLEAVADHWISRKDLDRGRFRPLSRGERSAVVGWLAPSSDTVLSLRARLSDVEAELFKLTELQARALRGMRTKARALIRGGAGTGKTLLAVEEASRLAAEGRQVLFCCRSPLLASDLRPRFGGQDVECVDLESLMRRLVDATGATGGLPDADAADLFSLLLPEAAAEAAIELGLDGSYGALVVDEGQDLLFETALDLFDLLLEGGLEDGTWRIFLDHKQNVFSAVDHGQLQRLRSTVVTEHDLIDNCRNTDRIAWATSMLSAVPPDELHGGDGPEVDVRFAGPSMGSAQSIADILVGWRRQGVDLSEVVILGEGEKPPNALVHALRGDHCAPTTFPTIKEGHPAWCCLEDFKGLEAGAVIVSDVKDLDSREMLRRVYVGCSRARTLLAVVLTESCRESFSLRAAEFARRQSVVGV